MADFILVESLSFSIDLYGGISFFFVYRFFLSTGRQEEHATIQVYGKS